MAFQQNPTAALEQRVAAVERVLEVRARDSGLSVDATFEDMEENFVATHGARVVARAWIDPEFRRRLLADGKAAVAELGIPLTPIQRQLSVLENTPAVHCLCGESAAHFLQDATRLSHDPCPAAGG